MVNTSGDLWNLGDMMAERLVADQLTHSYQIDSAAHSNSTQQAVPGPTGPNPSIDPYPGDYHFKVEFHRLSDNIKNKSWDVSYLFLLHNFTGFSMTTIMQACVSKEPSDNKIMIICFSFQRS